MTVVEDFHQRRGNGSSNQTTKSKEVFEEWLLPNETFVDHDNPMENQTVRAMLIVLYSTVFVCCFIGNLLVITVIALHCRMRTITNFFLANLAVADLCVGVFCVLPNLSRYLQPYWILGRAMCKMHYFVQAMSYTASISILTVISLERYVAIIHPMRSKQFQTMWLLRATVVGVWLVAACSGIPQLVVYDTLEMPIPDGSSIAFCMQLHPFNAKAYTVASLLLWYIIPLALMTLVYGRVSIVLWRSSRNAGLKSSTGCGGVASVGGCPGFDSSSTRLANRTLTTTADEYTYSRLRRTPEYPDRRRTRNSVTWDEASVSHADVGHRGSECLYAADSIEEGPDGWPLGSATDTSDRRTQPASDRSGSVLRGGSSLSSGASRSGSTCTGTQTSVRSTAFPLRGVRNNALCSRRKVIRLLVAIVVTFALCVLPYHVRVLWMSFDVPYPGFWHRLVPPLTFVLYYANSGLNPLLYAFLSEKFRASLADLMRCRDSRQMRRISVTMRTFNSVAELVSCRRNNGKGEREYDLHICHKGVA